MKSLQIMFALGALMFSSTESFANSSKYFNGTYASYSKQFCGFHIDRDGANVVLTYVNNPMFPWLSCDTASQSHIATCDEDGRCSFRESNPYGGITTTRLRTLEGGNILFAWEIFNGEKTLLSSGTAVYPWFRSR